MDIAPRTGHLVQAIRIFKHLDLHLTNTLGFDPRKLDIPNPSDNTIDDRIQNMRRIYSDAHKAILPNASPPRSAKMQINCFFDASHGMIKLLDDLKLKYCYTAT